jgi:hypothetical protein
LQAAGKKLSEQALSFFPMERSETNIPFGAEVIDAQIPLVLLGLLTPKYSDRLGLHLIKPPREDVEKMTDPKYLYENCTVYVDEKLRRGDIVSEMAFFDRGNNTWYQHHRKTYPKYSRQIDSTGVRVPIGKEMLEASEKIVAITAKRDGEIKTSLLEPAQIGVMHWAVQNGYKPATPEDLKLWERVQAGDSAFYIQDYINVEYNEKNPDYVYWKDSTKVFSDWKDEKEDKMVRIKFEKKFYPHEQKNAWDTAEKVSDSVKNVLGM